MPKQILTLDLHRPNTSVPWGLVICGGRDQVEELENSSVRPDPDSDTFYFINIRVTSPPTIIIVAIWTKQELSNRNIT